MADPIGYTPVGGESFGMGGAYSADYEDSTAILLNPAGTVEPRKKNKKKHEKHKKRKSKGSISTGFNARLVRRASPDFMKFSRPGQSLYGYTRNSFMLMSTGTTGRFQVTKYGFPMGLGVYLRKSTFSRLSFERFIGNSGRAAMNKDSGIYEGGVSSAIIIGRWAIGLTLKAFYGYSDVGRYLEYTSDTGSGIANYQYYRQLWGLGAAIGTRVEITPTLTAGLAIDLPNLTVYEKDQLRKSGVYRGSKPDSDYKDDYSRAGKRFSGPLIRVGISWKPSYRLKLSTDITLNPVRAPWENDFSDAHLLSAAMGVSFIAKPRHKVAMGITTRVLSNAEIRHPADTRTWAVALSLLYQYSSQPLNLPWVGQARIGVALGLRYTYTGGKIGGITANYNENFQNIAFHPAVLHAQALDTLLRVTIMY